MNNQRLKIAAWQSVVDLIVLVMSFLWLGWRGAVLFFVTYITVGLKRANENIRRELSVLEDV